MLDFFSTLEKLFFKQLLIICVDDCSRVNST